MSDMVHVKDIFILSTIAGLFLAGVVIALRSGVVSIGADRRRQILDNFSQLVVTLAGCLAFLTMAQQMVGIRLGAIW